MQSIQRYSFRKNQFNGLQSSQRPPACGGVKNKRTAFFDSKKLRIIQKKLRIITKKYAADREIGFHTK